jgi:hypothetical protein
MAYRVVPPSRNTGKPQSKRHPNASQNEVLFLPASNININISQLLKALFRYIINPNAASYFPKSAI